MDKEIIKKGISVMVNIITSERRSHKTANHLKSLSEQVQALEEHKIPPSAVPPVWIKANLSKETVKSGIILPGTIVELASTAETVEELKRRLGKELYKMELDLSGGGRIAGRVCDCLSKKHRLGLEATAEELMSYEHNPVHGQVIAWLNRHGPEFEPAEIAKHDPEHYRALIPEVRAFRKQVMGTESLASLQGGS